MVTLALDMLAQAAIVALLLVPKATTVSKRLFARYLSSASARAFGVMAVLAVALVALLGRPRAEGVVVPRAISLEERLRDCKVLGETEAEKLGLLSGTLVVDVRPPSAFAAYHLEGSCNLTVDELKNEGKRIREAVGGAVYVVYLASEYGVPIRDALFHEDTRTWTMFRTLPRPSSQLPSWRRASSISSSIRSCPRRAG